MSGLWTTALLTRIVGAPCQFHDRSIPAVRLGHSILLREKGVFNKVDNYVFLDMIEIVKTCSD